ncbi:MAG: GntR family transcriptional regulator [Acidobacteria bacterium]|jgi:GntR family transcriptional regulator|nr:GntR family transcriptional regulator [Acidobacteriota bacterium]
MLPFHVEITSGESAYRQIVYAATKAIVSGELLPGAPFPSVRAISQALKVNPNTAQKAVSELVREGLLEVQPGVGTLVGTWGPASAEDRRALLRDDLERLIVEARRLGLSLADVETALAERWAEVFGTDGAPAVDATGTEASA